MSTTTNISTNIQYIAVVVKKHGKLAARARHHLVKHDGLEEDHADGNAHHERSHCLISLVALHFSRLLRACLQ